MPCRWHSRCPAEDLGPSPSPKSLPATSSAIWDHWESEQNEDIRYIYIYIHTYYCYYYMVIITIWLFYDIDDNYCEYLVTISIKKNI